MQFRFGDLVIAGLGRQEFEVIRLQPSGSAAAAARFKVDEAEFPRLILEPVSDERRVVDSLADTRETVILDNRRGDHDTLFELTARPIENGIEIQLSGDHRLSAGARFFKVFLWRAECRIVDGQFVLHGPFLLRDLDS